MPVRVTGLTQTKQIWFNGDPKEVPVFFREQLSPGDSIEGPALVLDPHSTIVIEPEWKGVVDKRSTLILNLDTTANKKIVEQRPEVARLELFTNQYHRF